MTLKAISEQLNKPTLNAISNDVIKIDYVDGLCGSGKTFGLGKYMQKSPNEHKFIITTPSRILATQIFDQFIELGIEHVYKIVRHLAANHRGVVLHGHHAKPGELEVSYFMDCEQIKVCTPN